MTLLTDDIKYHVMPGATAETLENGSLLKMEPLARSHDSVSYLFSVYQFNEHTDEVDRVVYFKRTFTPAEVIRMTSEELEQDLNNQWNLMKRQELSSGLSHIYDGRTLSNWETVEIPDNTFFFLRFTA